MELCKAVILKTQSYSDTRRIIHVYSLEKGYLSLMSPSFLFKRKNNPIHLMQVSEIEYSGNERSRFQQLNTISPLLNLPALYFDVVKMNILLLWGEVLDLLLKNEGKNEALFEFVVSSVEYLNSATQGVGNFNLLFLYRLAGLIGYRIHSESWQEGYVFSIQDGGFHPADDGTARISGPNTATAIHKLCTCPVHEAKDIPLNQSARNTLLDIIFLFYTTHLGIDFNIKSIQVIREIFQK